MHIDPAQLADLPACAALVGRRPSHEPHSLRRADITDAQRLARKVEAMQRDLEDPRTVLYVAKQEGRIVGWANWLKPGGEQRTVEQKYTTERDPELDFYIIEDGARQKEKMRVAFFGEQPIWTLRQLFVDQTVKRSGIGRKLLEHGLALTGDDALIGLSSSPSACALYRQYGFVISSWFEYDREDLDPETGKRAMYRFRWPYMVRGPVRPEQQEALAAAGRRLAHEDLLDKDPELLQ